MTGTIDLLLVEAKDIKLMGTNQALKGVRAQAT